MKPWIWFPASRKLGTEVCVCNLSIQEVKAGGLEFQGGARLIEGQSILYETFSGIEKQNLFYC